MPTVYEILVDIGGSGEKIPATFDFTTRLSALGSLYCLSGTPAVAFTPADGNLTIGAPAIDTTQKLVQVVIQPNAAAAAVGNYRGVCTATATDNAGHTYTVEVRGSLDVTQIK